MIEIGRMQLLYTGKSAAEPAIGKIGKYLGSGSGHFEGSRVSGEVSWSLYENQSDQACDAYFTGQISPGDTDSIDFEMLGYFQRAAEADEWNLASGIRFRPNSDFHACFANLVGLVEGVFNMRDYRHDYRVFAPICDI